MAPANDNEAEMERQKLRDYKDVVKRLMLKVTDLITYLRKQNIEIQESNGMLKSIIGAVVAFIVGGIIIGIIVWNVRSPVQVATTGPVLTDVQVQKIVTDQLTGTNKSVADLNTKADGIQTSVSGLEKSMGDAKATLADFANRFDALKASSDAAKTSADNASAAAVAAQASADAAKATATDAKASSENLLGNVQKLATATGQLADQTNAVDKRVAALEAKLGSGAIASATTSPTTATATVTPASPTGFTWPAKLNERQILVYAKCAGQDWKDVDGETVNQLLMTYTTDQAAKFFSDNGDCQGFITQAAGVSKIKRQLEAQASQPEQPPAAVPTVQMASAAPRAMTPATTMPQAAGPVGRGCPALGSAEFLRINPRPAGDGWEMVSQVPGKPCGGWHRRRFG